MEKKVEDKMEAIMRKPGVVGAICVDKHGLPISAKGIATPNMGGVIQSLAEKGRKLGQDQSRSQGQSQVPLYPVIKLESDQGYCLIQKKGDCTLGIFKKH